MIALSISAPGRINEYEASPLLGIDNESELFHCFSIVLDKILFSGNKNKTRVLRYSLEFENWLLSLLLMAYHYWTVSSSANKNTGFVIVH